MDRKDPVVPFYGGRDEYHLPPPFTGWKLWLGRAALFATPVAILAVGALLVYRAAT